VRLPDPGGQTIGGAVIVRTTLTPAELAEPMLFSVTLSMRDFAGLEARIAAGEKIPWAEMEARYLPLSSDYERVASWLSSQGFATALRDRSRSSIFVRGPVSQVAQAFGVQFARVSVSDGEYTSAVTDPSLPADLAPVVLSVNDLQPEFRMRPVHFAARVAPDDVIGGFIYVTPDNVASAYAIPATATGAGQTVAILLQAVPATGDLSTFWATVNSAQSVNNVTTVNYDGGPSSPTSDDMFESSLDVEWAGAIAPGAAIRMYVGPNALEAATQVINDLPSVPSLTVVSSSYGNTEQLIGSQFLQAASQTAAVLASQGVSNLTASGDAGSNPNASISAGQYSASAPLGVTYPASDPSVTGVGGTTINYTGNFVYSGEIVWNEFNDAMHPSASASGGGISSTFSKPSWQTGGSLLAGQTMRCVPDIAGISDGDFDNLVIPGYKPNNATNVAVLIIVGGSPMGAIGTSLACPVWAGITALINQARAANGQAAIGLLNPFLYPLQGTGAFNDVTSGNNGAYSAGPGYDLCTGLGSPDVANLLAALSSPSPQQRLVNISARAEVETGSNIVIAGFVIGGPAGSTKDVLVRGIGPALSAFGVSGFLAQPVVSVYDSAAAPLLIASNTGWGSDPAGGNSAVAASFRPATAADMKSVGAFALTANSADSAMVLTLPTGAYTVQVSGAGGSTGVALTEVYEVSTVVPEVLENISARCFVGTGSQVAISGFVVEGTQPAHLLIRGIGPALAGFGVSGSLAQPEIEIFDQSTTLIASDTGWGNPPVAGTSTVAATFRQATAADMKAVGAFSLTAGSNDSAIVVTLPPGAYTAEVSGVGSTTGTALAEVYEMSGP
jgi:kumamolisin